MFITALNGNVSGNSQHLNCPMDGILCNIIMLAIIHIKFGLHFENKGIKLLG